MNPQVVIDVLGECRYRPDAKHSYDILRGGLVWDDELPDPDYDLDRFVRSISLLARVINHRASLTLGETNPKYEEEWNALRSILLEWPGFRKDRIYGRVERELRVIKRRETRCLEQFEAELDAEGH